MKHADIEAEFYNKCQAEKEEKNKLKNERPQRQDHGHKGG